MVTEPDKVDSGALGTIALVLTFGVLGTALAVTALVRTNADELTAERSQTNDAAAALRGSQEADLHLPPAYIDQSAGTVRLPIERAMQVVVRDLRRNPQSATWPKPEPKPVEADGDGDGVEPDGAEAPDEQRPEGQLDPRPRAPGERVVPKPPGAPKPPPVPAAPKPPVVPAAPKPPVVPAAPKPPVVPAAPKPPVVPAPRAPAPAVPNP